MKRKGGWRNKRRQAVKSLQVRTHKMDSGDLMDALKLSSTFVSLCINVNVYFSEQRVCHFHQILKMLQPCADNEELLDDSSCSWRGWNLGEQNGDREASEERAAIVQERNSKALTLIHSVEEA